MDMLVKLYELKRDAALDSRMASQGVVIRRVLPPELPVLTSWIEPRFGAGWAAEATAATMHQPTTCFIAIKDERLQRLQALLAEHQRQFAVDLLGRTIDLLIEKPGRQPGQKVGRSPWLQPVVVDETIGEIGDIVPVRIVKTGVNSLHAERA